MGKEMRPPRRRPSFFSSSLKQVEERLKSEEKPQHHAATPPPPPISSSLSHSGVPLEFLSQPLDFPSPTASTSSSLAKPDPAALKPTSVCGGDDDISRLFCLLGISASADNDGVGSGGDGGLSDFSDSAFYSKVAGIKGPKSAKEARRLDGWIDYYLLNGGGGEAREPLRLAHLILGKAAYLNADGLEGVEFPATVEEFLRIDPPLS